MTPGLDVIDGSQSARSAGLSGNHLRILFAQRERAPWHGAPGSLRTIGERLIVRRT